MPKSIVRVSPPLLEQFLENLPESGIVVTGLSPAYLYSDNTLRVSIEGDDVPDSPETIAIFTRSQAFMRPTVTLRPYDPSQSDADGLYPYQRDFFRYLRELPASEHTNRRDGKSRISLMLAKVTDESHRRLGKSWLGKFFDRKDKP